MPDTLQQVISKLPKDVITRYDFSNAVYTKSSERMTGVVCPDHGEFSQYSGRFRKGWGCPQCGVNFRVLQKRTPVDKLVSDLKETHGNKYDYSKIGFVRMNSKITVTCPTHGDFKITANHHYYRKQGCAECENLAKKTRIVNYRGLSAASKIRNTGVDFFKNCADSHNGKYTYPDQEYKGAKTKITAICPEHGEFEQSAWKHLSGKGCKKCGAYTPQWESDVLGFVKSFGFEATVDQRILDGKEIDVYIESKKIGIELNGLHWHSERKRPVKYHYDKWKTAQDMGIQLIQIFEDEWVNNKQVVLGRIKAALGMTETYHARKTLLGVVPSDEAKSFLMEHHSQGAGKARVYYGLKFEGEWVAVASFDKARTGAMTAGLTDVWEVIRYASKGRVRGGFSKLFKRFVENYKPEKVISYCDLRYGTGSVYAATGFALDGVTEPDYWWVPLGKVVRVPRYQTQKHKLPNHPVLGAFYDPLKTEVEICHAAQWYRIFGVGHQRWLWTA